MGWFRQKKQVQPLVPGRDRSSSANRQPVYSYYAGGKVARETASRQISDRRRGQEPAGRTKSSRLSSYTIVLAVCTLVVLLCAVKVLSVTPQSKIVVSDTSSQSEAVSKDAIDAYAKAADAMLQGSILNRNKITLNTNGIAEGLRADFPELTSVVVTVPIISNRPVIYVSPSKPAFILQTAHGFYRMDGSGYILASVAGPDSGSLPLLKEPSSRTPEAGKQYLAASIVSFCSTVVYELRQGSIAIDYLELPAAAPYEMDVHVSGKPYYIRFNLQADAMQQSGAVVATLQQLGANTPSEYLDVRVYERAYYK